MDRNDSPSTVTVIVNSLPGTKIAFPISPRLSQHHVIRELEARIPWMQDSAYILTTNSRRIVTSNSSPVKNLLSSQADTFLPLRLTVPICGGKGGFGSNLRAQGAKLSSKKKKDGQDTRSMRNLDGRRLGAVEDAKLLGEYKITKARMEAEAKKKRNEKLRWTIEDAKQKRKQIEDDMNKVDPKLEAYFEEREKKREEERAQRMAYEQSDEYKAKKKADEEAREKQKKETEAAAWKWYEEMGYSDTSESESESESVAEDGETTPKEALATEAITA